MNTKGIALGYKKQEFERKLVGLVSVRTGERVAEFTLTEDKKEFKNGTNSIRIALSDLPKLAQRVIKPGMKDSKEFRIRMNSEGDAIEAVTPVRGQFTGKLVDLGKRESEDADPAPYLKVWNEGKDNENSYKEFFAVYEITEGVFKGVQLPAYKLHYKFEEDPAEEGFTRFAGDPDNPRATRLHQLIEWGQIHGVWSEPIRWNDDENILPELLERALDSDVSVSIVMDKGYIKLIQPIEDYESVDVSDKDAEDLDEDDVAEELDELEEKTVTDVTIKSKAPKALKEKESKLPKGAPAKKYTTKHSEDDDL